MRKKKQLLLPLPPLVDGKRERGGPTRASMRRRKKRLHLSTSSFGLIGKRERMEMGTHRISLHLRLGPSSSSPSKSSIVFFFSRVEDRGLKTHHGLCVMIVLKGSVPISFGGTEQPDAYGELVSIGGLSPDVNKKLSAAISSILEAKLSVPKSRFFVKFYDTKGSNFGWNGSTF
ncbi:hypothetical protein ACLB2K_032434 [Fragaria x ananassa]